MWGASPSGVAARRPLPLFFVPVKPEGLLDEVKGTSDTMGKPQRLTAPTMRELRWKAATDPLNGRITGPRTAEWDASGSCEAPRTVLLEGYRKGPDLALPPAIWIETRCRKCGPCRRERTRTWAQRMRLEIERSPRTWFVTLTMRPDQHHRFLLLARQKIRATELVKSEILRSRKEMPEKVRQELIAVTLYLKRLRKGGQYTDEHGASHVQPPSRFRYALVAEAHKSGEPHFHALVHELPGYPPLPRRWLAHQWPHGFGVWKVAALRDAWYTAKYVAKEGASRIRASTSYGNNPLRDRPDEQSNSEPLASGDLVGRAVGNDNGP